MEPLPSSVLPAGVRGRMLPGINGLDIHLLEAGFEQGGFAPLLAWLRGHVHSLGRTLPAEEIVRAATGRGLTDEDFRAYLEGNFTDKVFVVSFISNVLIAAMIVWVGDLIGVGREQRGDVVPDMVRGDQRLLSAGSVAVRRAARHPRMRCAGSGPDVSGGSRGGCHPYPQDAARRQA